MTQQPIAYVEFCSLVRNRHGTGDFPAYAPEFVSSEIIDVAYFYLVFEVKQNNS